MLSVTESAVRFQPHVVNIGQRTDFNFSRSDIASVHAFSSLGIIPNGVRVHLVSGLALEFVVERRSEVLAIIGPERTS